LGSSRRLKRGVHLPLGQYPQRHASCWRVVLLPSPRVQARDEFIRQEDGQPDRHDSCVVGCSIAVAQDIPY